MEREESFQLLKENLASASISTIANPNGQFMVMRDASNEEVGEVLMHNTQVVAYESKKLK